MPVDENDPEYRKYVSQAERKSAKKAQNKKILAAAIALCALVLFLSQVIPSCMKAQDSAVQGHIAAGDIQMPASSDDLVGRDARKVAHELIDAGFDKVDFVAGKDVSSVLNIHKNAGKIERISVNGHAEFKKGDWFNHASKISIQYHPKAFEEEYESIARSK